jgi:hydrogenase maturation factor
MTFKILRLNESMYRASIRVRAALTPWIVLHVGLAMTLLDVYSPASLALKRIETLIASPLVDRPIGA